MASPKMACSGGGNEGGNWAQLGEVVGGGGGEAAKRSHDAVVLMRTPLGTQRLTSGAAVLESTRLRLCF